MVSYRTLTRNARFSRIARTTWALVVVGFRPINVVAALSSLMGACNTENTCVIDGGLQHTEYISISLVGAYKTQNIIFYVHLSLMGPTICRMHVSLTEPKTHKIYTTALYNYALRVRLHVLTSMFEYSY